MSTQPQHRKVLVAAQAAAESVPRRSGVLVVEPDPDLQWHLARRLTIQGYRVVGTSSGDGALALLEQWPVALVLVDEDLPTMSGLETVKKIRAARPGTQVVLLTSSESPDVRVAARLLGVVGCLLKPLCFEAFDEFIAGWTGSELAEPAE